MSRSPGMLALGAVVVLWVLAVKTQGQGDPAVGKLIFERRCVGCHGRHGEGVGIIPPFTDARRMAARSDLELFEKISKGGRGTGMPAWEGTLGEAERWHLVAYIRTLAKSR